ncbi:MAG: beta-propeller fold lactonase family protein, partial [Arenicellales bacterium]|nr:beta-propeller fold lactonase family protein [Arenicellales bacterium]
MLDRDYNLFVGTYSDLDVLAHQPYAPIPGKGIYAMTLDRKGKLTLDNTYEALNPAVLIPHSNGRSIYAILETIIDEGDIFRYEIDADGSLSYCDQFRASGRSTCYLATAPNQDAAIVINYWDAIIDVVDVDGDGRLGEVRQSFKQYYRPQGQWRQVTD